MTDGWYWYEKSGGIPLRRFNADGSVGGTVEKDSLQVGEEIVAYSYPAGHFRATIRQDSAGKLYAITDGGLMFVLELDDDNLWGTRISVNMAAALGA